VRGRRRALREEVDYWRQWLAARGGKYAEEYAYRFDAHAEVADPALRKVLSDIPQREVSILDVGAGPASTVGCRFPGKALTVVAVDPLARHYDRLLATARVVPPVRTQRVAGEELVQRFGPAHFDIAYSRNALDHAVDPAVIVERMLEVVRPGGHVVLRHVRNEAIREAYVQLHQWNLDERHGQFVIWRAGHETNVSEALAGRAEVTCSTEPCRELPGEEWLVCVIRKAPLTPRSGDPPTPDRDCP
jgi:SAM-dependent methyltransferase